MKKSQIISFFISLAGLVISAFILYRKKASKLTYVLALAAALILFFAINYVIVSLSRENSGQGKEVDAHAAGTIISAGNIPAPPDVVSAEPIDVSEAQTLGHPSKNATGSTIIHRDNAELISPVMRLVR